MYAGPAASYSELCELGLDAFLHPAAYLERLTAYARYAPWCYVGTPIGAALVGFLGSEEMLPPLPDERKV
jgi:hypothetical protein